MKKVNINIAPVECPMQSGTGMDDFHAVMEQVYLDWRNNYLTLEVFAAAYGIAPDHAKAMIEIGRRGNIWL